MKFKSPVGRVFDGLIKAVENYCNGKCADCKLCAFCTYPMEDWIANVERDDTYSINNGVLQFTIPFEPIERYLK